MNKFRRFLGKISAETRLKMDYFGSKSPNNYQALGAPPPDPRSAKWLENVQDLLSLILLIDAQGRRHGEDWGE